MSQLDQDEKLIIEVQQYPGLYDQSSYDYRDLRKKESMWQSVAESLGMHGEFIALFPVLQSLGSLSLSPLWS